VGENGKKKKKDSEEKRREGEKKTHDKQRDRETERDRDRDRDRDRETDRQRRAQQRRGEETYTSSSEHGSLFFCSARRGTTKHSKNKHKSERIDSKHAQLRVYQLKGTDFLP
jgi:predicted nucleic acid binding AN1-type Zn finger protein